MKKLYSLLVAVIITANFSGQVPSSFKYQAVLRDASGNVKANANLSIEVSILQGSASGVQVFSENYNITTNEFGLVNLEIGSKNTSGFSAIDWADGPYFLKISADGTELGISQILSVPYALHAKTVETVDYNKLTNQPSFAIVATSGLYSDLSGKPTKLSDFTNDIASFAVHWVDILGKPSFAAIASTGSYNDLLNKPSLFSGSYADLTDKPALFNGTWTSLTGKPTTVAGYGITDAVDKAYVNALISRIEALEAISGLTDTDGNVYITVKIGSQIWMAENLKTTKYNDGIDIPLVTDNTTWGSLSAPAYCWPNNNEGFRATYGAIYNAYTVQTGKLCPSGWHVPTDPDWTKLTDYLGGEGVAGGKLKEVGNVHWRNPNTGATNETGFTAIPGILRDYTGPFAGDIDDRAQYWSSTLTDANHSIDRYINYNGTTVVRYAPGGHNRNGRYVRCMKD